MSVIVKVCVEIVVYRRMALGLSVSTGSVQVRKWVRNCHSMPLNWYMQIRKNLHECTKRYVRALGSSYTN